MNLLRYKNIIVWVQLLVRYYSVVYTNNVTFKASILYCVIKNSLATSVCALGIRTLAPYR